MLYLDLYQLGHPCPRGGKIPHNEIPGHSPIFFELIFQKKIVGVADDVFQVIPLLYLDHFELPLLPSVELQIFIDGKNS